MEDLKASLMTLSSLLQTKTTQIKSKEWSRQENLLKIKTELHQALLFKLRTYLDNEGVQTGFAASSGKH